MSYTDDDIGKKQCLSVVFFPPSSPASIDRSLARSNIANDRSKLFVCEQRERERTMQVFVELLFNKNKMKTIVERERRKEKD